VTIISLSYRSFLQVRTAMRWLWWSPPAVSVGEPSVQESEWLSNSRVILCQWYSTMLATNDCTNFIRAVYIFISFLSYWMWCLYLDFRCLCAVILAAVVCFVKDDVSSIFICTRRLAFLERSRHTHTHTHTSRSLYNKNSQAINRPCKHSFTFKIQGTSLAIAINGYLSIHQKASPFYT